MTTFSVNIQVADLHGTRWEELAALADSGSSFTTIPRSLIENLGISPTRKEPFEIANGQIVESDIGYAMVRAEGKETLDTVIFGEPGEPALLGAHTLEGLLLAVDPLNERLIPVHGLRLPVRRS